MAVIFECIMDENNNIETIKENLKRKGAKLSGTKAVLENRLKLWNDHKLSKKLYTVPTINTDSCDSQPIQIHRNWQNLTNFKKEQFNLSLATIMEWFQSKLAMNSFRKGRSLGLNQFVIDIKCCCQPENNIYFKSICKAEMKKYASYTSYAEIEKSEIIKATCSCVAGAGIHAACKHVAACFFVIEHFSVTGISLVYVSPTSQLLQWHKPSSKNDNGNKCFDDFMGYAKKPEEKSSECEKDRLMNLIINHRIAIDITRTRAANPYAFINDHCYIKESAFNIIKPINEKSVAQILDIERKTRAQSKSNLWKSLRKTRVTASVAGDIVKAVLKGRTDFKNICDRIINPKPLYVAAVIHCKKTETKAFEEYKRVSNLVILKCGIFIDHERNYLAASPDGICVNYSFILEIKCPYKECDITKLHYIKNKLLNRQHNYFYQIQIQLHVTKVDKCIFIVYSDTVGFLHVETISYDREFTLHCLIKIDYFYKNIFCPELIKNNWLKA